MNRLFSELLNSAFLIAGPCVMESFELMDEIAFQLSGLRHELNLPVIFKASFDKANRTSVKSYRGPGLEKGLTWLNDVREKYNLPVTTDIHETFQAKAAGEVADIIQIPAFLCRQTDLLLEAGKTGKTVNIKKAQFLAADDMKYPVQKLLETGNENILLTERGTLFGPGNLVVDFRNIALMKKLKFPVIMDCTHAVQQPGGSSTTGGNRDYIIPVAYAAKAFGVNGYFFEIHPCPDKALSDGPNMMILSEFIPFIKKLLSK